MLPFVPVISSITTTIKSVLPSVMDITKLMINTKCAYVGKLLYIIFQLYHKIILESKLCKISNQIMFNLAFKNNEVIYAIAHFKYLLNKSMTCPKICRANLSSSMQTIPKKQKL